MPADDLLRRLLDAGAAFTQMTQQRAEEIVRDFVRAGEVQSEQTQSAVQDLVERSRQNTERLLETVRGEIRNQVAGLGLATADDVDAIRRELSTLRSSTTRRPAARKATRKKKATTTRAATKKRAATKRSTASVIGIGIGPPAGSKVANAL